MRDPYLPHRLRKPVHDLWLKILILREKHIKEKTLVMILSLAVGILAGLAAMVLKWLIHFISGSLTVFVNVDGGNYLYIIYPCIGILLACWYVRYVVKDNISHGVTRVLYSISQNKSRLKPHNMYTSVVASSITIGFGGSVGAEGPIVYTGAAIGSNLGQAFRLSPRVLMILVGCGAAAGIAGIFKAPIAGMLFTLEVLMLDLTTVTVMPLLIASITAASVAYIFTGYDLEFFFVQSEPFVDGETSVLHRPRHFLRTDIALFHPCDEHDGEVFQTPPPQTMATHCCRRGNPGYPRVPFPSPLRRRLRLDKLPAQR